MRKKPRHSNPMETSFLEEFADEFFTCSYFFKCLGDVAVHAGEEAKSKATSCCMCEGCCIGANACVDKETVEMDEPVEGMRQTDTSNVTKRSRGFFQRATVAS